MNRTIIEATYIDPNVCFECGAPATERHHVIPFLLGGTKTIPLCGDCHAKVHGISGERRNQLKDLTKKALADRKKLIETEGGFYNKYGKWVDKLGREKGADISLANQASVKVKKEKAQQWMEASAAVKLTKERHLQGVSYSNIVRELGELWEIDAQKWGTREGAKPSKGVISKWINVK